jgi:triacylglycerol esterase/lipase EstA (alpha/beta hydrolase family)
MPSMRKISFIAYSVGGLVARYAIGRLYNAPENEADSVGTICGLLAMNFITLATPHLGSSGNWQVSFFVCLMTIHCFYRLLSIAQNIIISNP